MTSLEDWLAALSEHLGIDLPPEIVGPVLDLARDAAHSVQRPAAPLSTFVAGYAAALAVSAGVDQPDARILEILERARLFAEKWSGEES
ncbi:MAG TPA: DUF6457 domain-containing protein [Leifsonia sp.]|nr:DUF6457 domain-containing protein [Leifsonia sp.]